MAGMLCWQTTWCAWPPRAVAAAALREDCVVDGDVDSGYEELLVSVPPHFPRGLSRDDDSSSSGGEEATVEVEHQTAAPSPDGGGGLAGAGTWLARVCKFFYGKVAGPFRS